MAEAAAILTPAAEAALPGPVTYDTHPDRYAHWTLAFDGPVATLVLNINEDRGLRPGYKLKLNSYDLGVDIELHDALQRIRFEHPEVRSVVVTSGRERIFCSGANIFMLGLSSHAWKVNFCKFTNETRNGIATQRLMAEDQSVPARRGPAVGAGGDLDVRTADAYRHSLDLDRAGAFIRFGNLFEANRVRDTRLNRDCLHDSSSEIECGCMPPGMLQIVSWA